MNVAEIEGRILTLIPGAATEIEGADCDFSVTVLSDAFANMPIVKRQQWVLSAFSDVLRTGELHALTVKAKTLEEWSQKASHLVQLSL